MMRRLLRGAIRNATVTAGDGHTLRVDPILLRAANILPLEEVEIVNHATGERFVTFAEAAAEGSGTVAVSRVRAGDTISILSWGFLHDGQTLAHRALLATVDGSNQVIDIAESGTGG